MNQLVHQQIILGPTEALSVVIDNNPRGVYNHIHRQYPGLFGNWQEGMEKQEAQKEMMLRFLLKRGHLAGDVAPVAQAVMQDVKWNPNADNWTTEPDSAA